MAYTPITLANSSGLPIVQYREPEGATQTFVMGAVLKLSSGMLVAGDTANPWSAADVVYGVAAEPGHNLTTANTAEPAYSEGSPQNQTSAKIIPVGAWSRDGKVSLYRADGNNIFLASLKSGQTYAQTLVIAGTYYALVYDSSSKFWYVDNTDTSGNNNVVEMVGGVSDDTSKCLFRFISTQRYFL